ncbi:MAG: HU family DNA-binding protein [Acidobacteriota bacterium]
MAGKSDIVNGVVDKVGEGLTRKQVTDVVDALFEQVSDVLVSGDKVQVAGFGSFLISERPERQGRNPQTGEAITIAASKGVRFKAGKKLKDAVNA